MPQRHEPRATLAPTMQQRQLGQSSLRITPLALGGNVFGWTADEATSFAVLDAFVAHGGNAIDTADGYSYWVPGHSGGESETVIGQWLKNRGRRDDVVIGTKVGWWEKRKGLGAPTSSRAARTRCDGSASIRSISFGCTAMTSRRSPTSISVRSTRSSKPAKCGPSGRRTSASHGSRRRSRRASGRRRPVSFVAQQPEYSLLNREIEKELMPLCVREGIAILPYFPLASGFLTGKYRSSADKTKSVRGGGAVKHLDGKGKPVLAALDAVAARHGATCAQVALAWVMAKPAIAAPIASATSVAQITELMGALELTLTAADVAALDEASA